MLLDRGQRRLALAGQDLVEDRDVALLARRRAGGQLERPRARRLGLVAAAHQLLGAGERDVAEREALVGGDRLGKRGIGAGGGGHQAVDAAPIGVARRRRAGAELVAVAILQHHAFSLPAVASHIGDAIVSVKLVNIKLKEMLMRSRGAVVGRHVVLHPGREDQQPAFLALGIGAVGGEPRVLARLGHDHRLVAGPGTGCASRPAARRRSRRRSGSCWDDGASGDRRRAD